ncbi:MAG: hypothetical protein IJ481_01225, partial [Alphaproteobacteria bacterium]|nr:hypothetical protein [Alphaproteobacteria bacterium]
MSKITNKYKALLYLAILGGGNIGEVYSSNYTEVDNPITIGSTPSVPTETDYNYWSTTEDNTYVFNTSSKNSNKYWIANNTVTINNGYTLKLTTNYTNDYYYYVLFCYNTFTNYGNVIIDNYGILGLNNNYTSNNYGTIDIINGVLGLYNSATLNNTRTITLKGSSVIDIDSSSTLTNKGTIDISNITNLSKWCSSGIFTLEGGSTFILPKSIPIPNSNNFNIQLNGTKDKPVIFKYYT